MNAACRMMLDSWTGWELCWTSHPAANCRRSPSAQAGAMLLLWPTLRGVACSVVLQLCTERIRPPASVHCKVPVLLHQQDLSVNSCVLSKACMCSAAPWRPWACLLHCKHAVGCEGFGKQPIPKHVCAGARLALVVFTCLQAARLASMRATGSSRSSTTPRETIAATVPQQGLSARLAPTLLASVLFTQGGVIAWSTG